MTKGVGVNDLPSGAELGHVYTGGGKGGGGDDCACRTCKLNKQVSDRQTGWNVS